MRETSILDNKNYKTQAHARVCEENKLEELELELEEKTTPIETILRLKGASLKDHIGRVEKSIKTIFSRMIHHTIKVLAIFYFKHYCMCKMTFGSHHGNQYQNTRNGWFLRMVAPI